MWLAQKAAKFVALNLEIDHEKKTWKLLSKPIWNPVYQERYYDDISKIFKCDPRRFDVVEERDSSNRFRRLVISTS